MFNVKWAVIPAAAALVLAMLTSLVFGQVGFGTAVLRALLFSGLFFVIGCGAWFLVSTYIPELLILEYRPGEEEGVFRSDIPGDGQDYGLTGGNVNITLQDGEAPAVALPGDSYGIDGIGSISELVSAAAARDVDQNRQNDYTEASDGPDFAPPAGDSEDLDYGEPALDIASLGDFSAFFDGPTGKGSAGGIDESLSDLFETLSGGMSSPRVEEPPPRKPGTSSRRQPETSGDFNAKDLAMGIRTALATEKRG